MRHLCLKAAFAILITGSSSACDTARVADPAPERRTSLSALPLVKVSGHVGTQRDGPPPSYADDDPAVWVIQHASIIALQNAVGDVSGHVQSKSTFPKGDHLAWTEAVLCLVVEGNTAWVGTVVVQTTSTEFVPVGRRFVYRFIDDGPDDYTQRGRDLTDCTLKPAVGPMVKAMHGDLRIVDQR